MIRRTEQSLDRPQEPLLYSQRRISVAFQGIPNMGKQIGRILAGVFAAIFVYGASVLILYPLWMDLGWRTPIADALVSAGFPELAAHWGMVWIKLPEWLLGGLLGAVIGLAFGADKWIAPATAAGLTFFIAPHIGMLIFLGLEGHPYAHSGLSVAIRTELWSLPGIAMFILAACVAAQLRSTDHQQPSDSHDEADEA